MRAHCTFTRFRSWNVTVRRPYASAICAASARWAPTVSFLCASEPRVKKEELYDALDRIDPALAMEALIRVLQMNPGTAIKPFRTYREAEAFLAFIEQIAEQDEKEKARRGESRLV